MIVTDLVQTAIRMVNKVRENAKLQHSRIISISIVSSFFLIIADSVDSTADGLTDNTNSFLALNKIYIIGVASCYRHDAIFTNPCQSPIK